jgi:lipoic acid synthetase
MPPRISPKACLSLTHPLQPPALIPARFLATAVPDPPSKSTRQTAFTDRLNAGRSFADFVSQPESPLTPSEALELRTAEVGPPGRRRTVTRLPEWLKTPIPGGDSFKKIKADLRGLNLHTGTFLTVRE